uniref:hypothetical protein n=1 Tax=Porphyrobacter sp. GA68 TaxID=2883480 RepID=UPI001D17DA79|nr:hypothetical protein [Porphyrobacter sp. GA68]
MNGVYSSPRVDESRASFEAMLEGCFWLLRSFDRESQTDASLHLCYAIDALRRHPAARPLDFALHDAEATALLEPMN